MENIEEKIGRNFGLRLKKQREELNFTQDKLAKRIGVSTTSIQNYEAGKLPKSGYVIKLSEVLNCTTDYLLIGKTDAMSNGVQANSGINGGLMFQNNGSVKVIHGMGQRQAEEMAEEKSLKAMRLLTKVMASGNATLINIAMSQLVTLAQAVDEEKKETL